MHTVELLEAASDAASKLGFRIRREWLAGQGGGACTIRGEKWLFVDLACEVSEQLDDIVAALREEHGLGELDLPEELVAIIKQRQAA